MQFHTTSWRNIIHSRTHISLSNTTTASLNADKKNLLCKCLQLKLLLASFLMTVKFTFLRLTTGVFLYPKSSGGGARILEEWQWSLLAQIITWTQNIQVVKQKPIQLKTSFSWKLFRPKPKHFKIKSTRSMYTSRIEFYPKNLPGTLINLNL